MSIRNLSEMKRTGVEVFKDLKSAQKQVSERAGLQLCQDAASFGLGLRDYLTLSVDPALSEDQRIKAFAKDLTGYEATLAYLGIPTRDDFKHGVHLQLAADTFASFPGTRALFPEVIDDVLRWEYRTQDQFENTQSIVSQTRTINAAEMISTVVDDAEDDYEFGVAVAEGARVPTRTIKTSEYSVKIWKHGLGYEFTYEFLRRAALNLVTPYRSRVERQIETSKVAQATSILINGDGNVFDPAPEINQSSLNSSFSGTSTNGTLGYKHLLAWLVSRARKNAPVDTVVGNWDAYLQWLSMFALPGVNDGERESDTMARAGFQIGGVPILTGQVNFALSSSVPDGKLIGITKNETLEELVESGSDIEESERSIQNQKVMITKTINAGYRLIFKDTREVLNYGA